MSQLEAANKERLALLSTAASRAQDELAAAEAACAAARAALAQAQGEWSALGLELVLERLATQAPPEVLVSVLRHLPAVELARLACVHRAFWVALKFLRPLRMRLLRQDTQLLCSSSSSTAQT